MTTIAGKNSNVVGNKDTTLILRGTSLKYQFGNKFIDLIKNGKINSESEQILKTADSIDSVQSDGIYLVDENIWAIIGGTKVQLSDSTTTYVSYLVKQEDVTAEQKTTALTNIGFYYDTYQEAEQAGLTSGLIYVKGDNKLYVITDGILKEYSSTLVKEEIVKDETPIQKLYIQDYVLYVGADKYITCENQQIITHKPLVIEEGLQSSEATSDYGYRIYMRNGKSVLEIDEIVERDKKEITIPEFIPIYSQHNNIIDSTESDEGVIYCTLRNPNKYQVGDTVFVALENAIKEYTVLTSEEQIITLDIPEEEKEDFVNSCYYIYLSNYPYIRIQENNLELFQDDKIHTKIGIINEDAIEELKTCTSYSTNIGIYSNNFIGLESKMYDTVFKYRCHFPKYDEGLVIPDDSNDQTIVTSSWTQKQLVPIKQDIEELKNNTSTDELKAAISNLENNVTNIENNVSALKSNVSSLQQNVTNIQQNIETIQQNIISLQNVDNSLQTQINSNKTLIQNNTTSIQTNATNIQNLTTNINSLETSITNLQNDLESNYVKKDELSELITQYMPNLNGSATNPIVLLSGYVKYSSYNKTFTFSGTKKEAITNISISATGGLLKIALECSGILFITSIHVTQADSGAAPSVSDSITSINARGAGAHWYGANYASNTLYIREFHQGNDNNDSWASDIWEDTSQAAYNINLSVFGYIM